MAAAAMNDDVKSKTSAQSRLSLAAISQRGKYCRLWGSIEINLFVPGFSCEARERR